MIADLGKSIGNTLQGLFKRPATDTAVEEALRDICVTLIKYNVSPKHVSRLREDVRRRLETPEDRNRARAVQKAVVAALTSLMTPGGHPYTVTRGRTNVVVFVGLQGAGKTTTVCKYAAYHKAKGFRAGIVCADTFRAGAYDQVKQNATKAGVAFYGSSDPDPVKVAREGVARFRKADFELILVDTSGRHTQESALFEEMKGLVSAVRPDNIVFVVDAGIGQSAESQAAGFKAAVPVGGIVLTKLDGAERAGGALSAVASAGVPVEFVGTGEAMCDLEPFVAKRFVGRMLGMGDIEGLVAAVSSIDINQEEMAAKMSTGKFRLADFKKIYMQLLGLGPLSKMLSMIPGMQGVTIPDETKFRRISHIFDSLCSGELNSNGDIFAREPSRIRRVALGSGCTEAAVQETILNFKQMNNLMKNMMNNPMFSQMLQGLPSPDNSSLDSYVDSLE